MSLRDLPEIQACSLPQVCAFEPASDVVGRWNEDLRAAASDNNTISILDQIGADFFGEGVTSKRVAAALRSIGAQDVIVEINSPGGDFFEGVAIYNALRAHPHKVTVRVIGIAASAASLIAMAGDRIEIGQAGFLMVHNAWVAAQGNRHDLLAAAETIAPFDDAMAGVYSARAGIERGAAAAWLDAETWFSGEQAIEAGLADALLPADAVQEVRASTPNAVRAADMAFAKAGVPRSQRRALLADLKSGTQDAAPAATQDAGALSAALAQLKQSISR